MKLTFLGTGTSHGVPVIACSCPVCTSVDPRNVRTRSSVLLDDGRKIVVIDTGPDFRAQMLRERIDHLDAVIFTHDHADHLNGIDDLRVFTWHKRLPVYAATEVLEEIGNRFSYIFSSRVPGGGKPNLDVHSLSSEGIVIGDMHIVPVPIFHGSRLIHGYRIGSLAYLTDCSGIPEESFAMLSGVKILVVGALRYRPHPTHFSVSQAVEAAQRIGAEITYLTHICHDLDHSVLEKELPEGVFPAYDGLSLTVGI